MKSRAILLVGAVLLASALLFGCDSGKRPFTWDEHDLKLANQALSDTSIMAVVAFSKVVPELQAAGECRRAGSEGARCRVPAENPDPCDEFYTCDTFIPDNATVDSVKDTHCVAVPDGDEDSDVEAAEGLKAAVEDGDGVELEEDNETVANPCGDCSLSDRLKPEAPLQFACDEELGRWNYEGALVELKEGSEPIKVAVVSDSDPGNTSSSSSGGAQLYFSIDFNRYSPESLIGSCAWVKEVWNDLRNLCEPIYPSRYDYVHGLDDLNREMVEYEGHLKIDNLVYSKNTKTTKFKMSSVDASGNLAPLRIYYTTKEYTEVTMEITSTIADGQGTVTAVINGKSFSTGFELK